jgi:DtxR family Mn-dependent transcriptional regulator
MASSTVENYLKAILHLEEPFGSTTVGEIAKNLGVTPGTVTIMMKSLSEQGLVNYQPRKKLNLMPGGRKAALKVVRRHRLIELFLVQVLKLDWSEVHEEAEILEHVISDRLLDRIDKMLGEPTHDPHGDPIPDRDGNLAVVHATPLAEVGDGDYRVVRVSDDNPDLLGWLNENDLTIGEEFVLTHPNRAAGVLEIARKSGSRIQLGVNVAEQVYVESLKP